MMRWLKEKKRGEKKSSGGHEDHYKEEDDYGFEKEKPPNKSPVVKRELPPTPAAPEEKSTHIYEEIPDLHVSCTPASERTSLLKNKKQGKSSGKAPSANTRSNNRTHLGSRSDASCLDDSISPYMVVPVDEEVRHTPPHFNRNGTPEVHCDLIVKDTHCEILLTRKPKIGAFRLDSTALTGSESGSGAASGIRNNTHFCSRNRRASVDVQAGGEGKGASAFSWSSSAFSSASTSKVNSMGRSSMSLSTLQEHRPHNRGQLPSSTVAEGDSGSSGSSAKGVMTYSTASNFIPRSTKLVFKPLTPLDPEMFDDPDQDIALRTAEMEYNGQNAAHPLQADDNESIEYTSVQGQTKVESGSPVVYSAIQDQDELQGRCEPSSPPNQQEIRQCQALSDNPFRSALIRPYSPSSSSSCTYASVNFPPEPRLYNTIQNMDMPETPASSHTLSPPYPMNQDGETILYPSIGGELCNEVVASRSCATNYSSGDFITESKFTGNRPPLEDASQPHPRTNFSIHPSDGNRLDGPGHIGRGATSDGAIYSGIGNPCDLDTDITYSCIDTKEGSLPTHTTASLLQNKMDGGLVLDFCTCQDYHQYSSCGCVDVKADDDDNVSVATTANEIKGSCSGCGRLIRQITYSESYSDETYEHAYSSRLLLRKGRRFSSPDITLSEISNSESQDLRFRQGSPFSTMSRDDMFSRSQTCDVQSTFFRPDGDLDSSRDHPVVLNGRDQRSDFSNSKDAGLHGKSVCAFGTPNDPIVSTKSESVNEYGNQHLKRASLPLSTNSSSSPLIPSDIGHTKATTATQLQPKSSTFSGLFSKFSKSKVKSVKLEHECLQHSQQTIPKGTQEQNVDVRIKPCFSVNLNPEKNVLKLSKFFQRLSVKDAGYEPRTQSQKCPGLENNTSDTLRADLENFTPILPDLPQDLFPQDEGTDLSKRTSHDPDSVTEVTSASKTYFNKNKDNSKSNYIYSKNNASSGTSSTNHSNYECTSISGADRKNSSACLDGAQETKATASHPTPSSCDTKQSVNSAVEQALPENGAKVKSANKTDSGDTCYEYDISTSSESEHTSYDYFLSKVKKSLNLEKEVQHIADMNALRKKLLCKVCKKGSAPDQCEMCGVDGACSHVPSLKCSDWRKFFGELVVDQRAAILDCLTDFAHSPYTVKGDGLSSSNQCRECGGEIMTSDSESLTTVYSLLSQQLQMTSPGAQTPSCDSDEGTMADNSCDSGDDEERNCGDGNNSSGFDDDDDACEQINPYGAEQHHHNRCNGKTKKREKTVKDKRDKKSYSHSLSERPRRKSRSSLSSLPQDEVQDQHSNTGQGENTPGMSIESLVSSQPLSSPHKHSRRGSAGGNKNQNHCNSQCYNSRKNALTLAGSSSVDNIVLTSTASPKDPGSDTNKDARAKTSLLATDKAIQDIYAPLPSKALSWLTARHIAQRNNPCACSRIPSSASFGSLSKSSTEADVQQNEDPGTKEFTQHPATLPQEAMNVSKENDEIVSNVPSKEQESTLSEVAITSFQESSRAKKMPPDLCSTNNETKSPKNLPDLGEVPRGSSSDQKMSPGLNLNRRRSRQLPLAALDLLPETAFGSDIPDEDRSSKEEGIPTTSIKSETPSSPSNKSKPPRPRLVERMTRLFESNGTSAQSKDLKSNPNVGSTNEFQKGRVHSMDEKTGFRKLIGWTNKDGFNNSHLGSSDAEAKTPGLQQQTAMPFRRIRSESKSGTEPGLMSKARTAMEERLQAHTTPTGSTLINVDHPAAPADNKDVSPAQKEASDKLLSKRGSITFNENKSTNREFTARKQAAPPSPTCSTSSSSSSISTSSLSRRKAGGQGKQKRLSRKSHVMNKKVKAKATDRKKKKKEEKTYYCFSSDISDIDVVEVEDWSVYSCQRSVSETRRRSHSNSRGHSHTKDTHHGSKEHKMRRERSASRGRDIAASTSGSKRKQASTRRENRKEGERGKEEEEEDGDDSRLVQEIYAMPPNSSEVCEVKTHRDEGSASPTASPELRKLRKKSKRTDIYKTKKSNNRLLSDLIISNYDRQVFGNV